MYTHTSSWKGSRNENSRIGLGFGFRKRIVIPRLQKGFVKSTNFSRAEVIVIPATARSASCRIGDKTEKNNYQIWLKSIEYLKSSKT